MPETIACKHCNSESAGNYCSSCGNPLVANRITAGSIVHEIFHFFTHLDKGFGYTLKQLAIKPGVMQRQYVEGYRSRHQKPFSMFFICASVTALLRYWINTAMVDYFNAGDANEGNFFHQYMVMVHTLLLPVYAAITWVLYNRSKYNYGEIVVLLLYTIGAFFLITDAVALLRFAAPDFNTDYVELSLLLVYNAITYINFFKEGNRWLVLAKSIINVVLVYLVANYTQDAVIAFLSH